MSWFLGVFLTLSDKKRPLIRQELRKEKSPRFIIIGGRRPCVGGDAGLIVVGVRTGRRLSLRSLGTWRWHIEKSQAESNDTGSIPMSLNI